MPLTHWINAKAKLHRCLPANSIRARLASGTFWSLVAAATTQLSAIAISIVAARILGQVSFGELAIVNSTVGMLGVFAGFGLGMTATKYVAEFRVKDPVRAGRIVALSIVVALFSGGGGSLVLAAFTPELASRSLAAPHLVLELRIGALLLFFNAVNGTQLGILAGLEAFQAIAQVNLLRSLLSLPLVVTGLLLGRLVGAVAALAVAAAVGCLINQIVVQAQCRRVEIPLQYRAITSQLPILWRFSLPAFLSGGLVGQVSWLANAMLVNQPNGYAEMGVFNAANQWRSAVLFLPHLISQVAVPILSSIQAAGDTPRLRSVLLGSMLTNAACALPLVLILFASSSLIMSLYGEQFTQRAAVLQVSLVSAALLAIQTPIGNVITAYGRMWLGFLMNAGWAACFLLTARWLLALGWGAQALASAYLAAYLVHALWTHWFAASVLSHRNHTQLAPAERTTIDAQPI